MRALVRRPVMVLMCALLSSSGWAQQTASGIAGTVRDTSGAVLPGVTVEAASPALIEKVRTVVTNGEGRYSIVDLRPGTYVVTFAITGFSTVKREGIELTAGFTAAVNADLQIGAVAETITVSGATPLVDTQRAQANGDVKDLLDALPSAPRPEQRRDDRGVCLEPWDVVGGYNLSRRWRLSRQSGATSRLTAWVPSILPGTWAAIRRTALTESDAVDGGISAGNNASGPVAAWFPGRW